MTTPSLFYNLIINNSTIFSVSFSSLQFTIFSKLISQPVNATRVSYDGTNNFYVDADIDSFTLIVSKMRGYKINENKLSKELRLKYLFDSKYFFDTITNPITENSTSIIFTKFDFSPSSSEEEN